MKKNLSYSIAALAFTVATVLGGNSAKAANFNFHVDLNVSSLIGNASGPFSLDFLLGKGNSVPNNTVTISNFLFTGGAPSGSATLFQGLGSGNMTSGITLTEDSADPFNEVYQAFTNTTSHIQFDVSMTQAVAGTQPDAFAISILDNTLLNIGTTDAINGSMAFVSIHGGNTLSDVATFTSTSPAGATAATSVPEPSSVLALISGAGCLLSFRRRRATVA